MPGVAPRPSQGSRRPRPSAVAVTDPCRWAALPRGTDPAPLTQASSQPGHQNPPAPAAPSPDPDASCTPSQHTDPAGERALDPTRRPRWICAAVLIRARGESSPEGYSGVGLLKRSPGFGSHQPTRVRCGRTPAPALQHGAS